MQGREYLVFNLGAWPKQTRVGTDDTDINLYIQIWLGDILQEFPDAEVYYRYEDRPTDRPFITNDLSLIVYMKLDHLDAIRYTIWESKNRATRSWISDWSIQKMNKYDPE